MKAPKVEVIQLNGFDIMTAHSGCTGYSCSEVCNSNAACTGYCGSVAGYCTECLDDCMAAID